MNYFYLQTTLSNEIIYLLCFFFICFDFYHSVYRILHLSFLPWLYSDFATEFDMTDSLLLFIFIYFSHGIYFSLGFCCEDFLSCSSIFTIPLTIFCIASWVVWIANIYFCVNQYKLTSTTILMNNYLITMLTILFNVLWLLAFLLRRLQLFLGFFLHDLNYFPLACFNIAFGCCIFD